MFRLPGVAWRLYRIAEGNDLPSTYFSAFCRFLRLTQAFPQLSQIEPLQCDGSFFNCAFFEYHSSGRKESIASLTLTPVRSEISQG
jgi:hypothetical protein